MSPVSKRIGAVIGKKRAGKPITFRRVTNTGGALNPVTGAITVQSSASIGASTVTLTAPKGIWTLATGDKFTVAGDLTVYTIGAPVAGTSTALATGVFANVPISPALAVNASAGAAVTMTWANDYPVKAIVAGYESRMIDGTTITAKDLRCLMQPTAADGRTIPTPGPLDKLGIDGAFRTVGVVAPQYAGASVSLWDVQAKG